MTWTRATARIFHSGTHYVDRDTTIHQTITLAPGTMFQIAAGATLTLLGDLVAPADQIFSGEGKIDLGKSRLLFARPEWWGAKVDDPSIDNAVPFNACTAAHTAMHLGPGDYHLSTGWTVDSSNRRIWGVGRTKDARSTRLLRHGARGSVLTVGQLFPPHTINEYARGLDIRWLELGRTEPPSSLYGEESDWPVGLTVRHVLDARFEGLRANEHGIGYSIRGAVRTFFDDCAAFRSTGGTDRPDDLFVGFDLDGHRPPIPTGANASLYLLDCSVNQGGSPKLTGSVGCRLQGAMSDTFLVRFETTSLDVGIDVAGLADQMPSAARRNAQIDFVIDTPILDQCRKTGIRIAGLSDEAMLTIRAPYVGLSAGASSAIDVSGSGGAIAVDHGQLVGTFAPAASGIRLSAVNGFSCSGTILQAFASPIIADKAVAFDLVLLINSGPRRMPGNAITLSNCKSGYVRPRIVGAGHETAVAADAGTRHVTVETAALPAPLNGPRLITRNGIPAVPIAGSTTVKIG